MKFKRYTIGWWEKAEFPKEVGGGPTWEWKERTFEATDAKDLMDKTKKEIPDLIEKYKVGNAMHIIFFTTHTNPPVEIATFNLGEKRRMKDEI